MQIYQEDIVRQDNLNRFLEYKIPLMLVLYHINKVFNSSPHYKTVTYNFLKHMIFLPVKDISVLTHHFQACTDRKSF